MILLHLYKYGGNDDRIFVNEKLINDVYVNYYDGSTLIEMCNSDSGIKVSESIDKVIKMIEESK